MSARPRVITTDELLELAAQQSARFTSIDPLLPTEIDIPHGEVIGARTSGGEHGAAVITRAVHGPGQLASLWSAREVWQLYPLPGASGAPGLAALLDRLRPLQRRRGARHDDSAWVVLWPSRDTAATRVLLDHGFIPLSVLAARQPLTTQRAARTAAPAVSTASSRPPRVRRADPSDEADIERALVLAMAELQYSANVGAVTVRSDAAIMKRTALGYRMTRGDPIWLAEVDGVVTGMAECRIIDVPEPEAQPATLARPWFAVHPGRWGYVNCLSVLPGARGNGIGSALMSVAHEDMLRAGATGGYLYYNPPNPLSSVFWPRHGYRPLWTVWEVRPARALR